MKSTVEQLSPTRVRINVEVPFTELEPDFDRAFKALAQQVRLPGFRPGKAPRKLLEARVGRGAVLEQVVNDALPSRYSEAVTASDVKPLGQPEIEVTKLEDGQELAFTAEVDVRPEITLPEFDALKITVDPIEVDDEAVDAELQSLRARFGTLTGVDRGAQEGDFVSIDLSATVDGNEVPEAATEGLSHEVGSGQLIEGLDEAITGLKAGESKVFTTKLAAGEYAGKDAEVTVTVKSVKERELPEADDDFAQLASEFDTIDELKESLTDQVRRVKSVQQAEQVRDKAIEALLEQTEVPLPEKIVQAQIDDTLHNAIHGLDHDEDKFAEQLTEQGSSREEFDAENKANAEKAVKTQLLMDAVADKLDIQVGQNDLTERLVLMSRQYGIEPQQLIQILQQNNQLPAMFADVRRGLTIAAVVHAATVTDTEGTVIDTTEFFGPAEAAQAEGEQSDEAADKDADATE
ncbi:MULTISPECIES: trigger factor [Mycolicibacterium]|uniref:Trigger factor n=1 Tax=Mycolicibacterium senegalense TaxID=1796 RepID=A0A378T1H6_9MYCO|nr:MULTISPECIES: trigger factor [Mycolicibacterium]MCV7338743.1 trigger factor [Mycolicibacterium senegalense]MDR7289550.1 trigger factor [Mycolicibacterium senegalense]QZA26379.1 trigger factor [Mycolicibacterium senegalense]CDP88999.1 trigger factor [Mycolicibacterium farcinogenes]STZ53723.1 trigger factor Tig [Mycolicibacterium senegalense]